MEGSHARDDALPIAGIVIVAGLALIIFGPNESRYFGVAYLIAAVVLCWGQPAWDSFMAQPRTIAALHRIPRASPGVVLSAMRVLWILVGAGLILYFSTAGDSLPRSIRHFYILLGSITVFWALAVTRTMKVWQGIPAHTASRLGAAIGATLCLAPAVFLVVVVVTYGSNLPFYDEYAATLRLIVQFDTMNRDELLEVLHAPYFSHRIVLTRLMALIQTHFFGTVNFYRWMIFNLAFLFVGFAMIFTVMRQRLSGIAAFAPAALIFFQLQYDQILLWAFGSPHLGAFFFAIASVVFVAARTTIGFWVGLTCAVCATYTFAFGMFAGLVGLCILLDQRRKLEAVYWLIPITLMQMSYFVGINLGASREFVRHAYNLESGQFAPAEFFFEFLGSLSTLGQFGAVAFRGGGTIANYPEAIVIARICGAILLSLFIYITFRRYWHRNPVVYGLLAITLLTSVAAAIDRSHFESAAFLSRYAINSALFAALIYLALAEIHPETLRLSLPLALAASALFSYYSNSVRLPESSKHAANLRFGSLLAANAIYQNSAPVHIGLLFLDLETLARAQAKGVYSIPVEPLINDFAADPLPAGDVWNPADIPSWRLLYAGENPAGFTFFLGPDKGGAGNELAAVEELGIVLVNRNGTAIGFSATPLDRFPGQDVFIDASAPEGSTHYAVVPSAAVSNGPWTVALAHSLNGQGFVASTEFRLPTVRQNSKSIPDSSESLLHLTSTCSSTGPDSREQCWFSLPEDGERVELPSQFAISVLAFPADVPQPEIEPIRIVYPAENPASGLRMTISDGAVSLFAGSGTDWPLVARAELRLGEPNFISLRRSTDSYDLVVLNSRAGVVGQPVNVITKPADPFNGATARLTLPTAKIATGLTQTGVHEIVVEGGPVNLSELVWAWQDVRRKLR